MLGMAKRSRLRRIGVVLLVFLVGGALSLAGAVILLSKPLPRGESGPAADALARDIEAAVHKADWDHTGAVSFIFAGRHRHLWDRQRGFDRVSWDKTQVLVNLTERTGVAYRQGVALSGAEQDALVKKAYAFWINDSFWLNPLAKLFDDGVIRQRVIQPDGSAALLISYKSGGLTPGDSYLWLLGPDGIPIAWQMWVSVIPIKGLKASFEGWATLGSGARISTFHKVAVASLRISEVYGTRTLAELAPGPDPFAPLTAALK